MRTTENLCCAVLLAAFAGCGGVDGEISYDEAGARGSDIGTTPPPAPSCGPSTCFESPSIPLPGQLDSAVVAESYSISPALKATADLTSAGKFVSQTREALVTFTNDPGDGAALDTSATQSTGETIGLLAETYSTDAAAMTVLGIRTIVDFAGTGLSFNAGGAVMRNGQQLGEFGPTGAQGPKGDKGNTGPKGADGSDGAGSTFSLCMKGSTCIAKCRKELVVQANGPCEVTSDNGACFWGGTDGMCCVCSL